MKAITLSGGAGVQMLLFRREVTLETIPFSWPVDIVADSRYRLFVNGQRVGDGPCRPSPGLRYRDRHDLAPYLTVGTNVMVMWLAYYPADEASNADFAGGPVAVLTGETPFFALDDPMEVWSTEEGWRCRPADGYTFTHIVSQLSFMETVDLAMFPEEMYRPGYDDSGWTSASPLNVVDDGFAVADRPIPYPIEEGGWFYRGIRQGGDEVDWIPFLATGTILPPHTDAWVELDTGVHTTAFPRLTLEGGQGARITITYAESYKQARPDGSLYKGRRDDVGERTVLDGFADCVIADGTRREWMPFWYRTFRYVRLHIRTEDTPLRLEPPRFVSTGYPLEMVARFTCDQEEYNTLWLISRRTLQNCMYETYMDCPYYEQLQYVMDTVLQMQYTSKLTQDTRLTRRAMADFFRAQLDNGLIPANSPAKLTQTIPGFALFAVFMLELYLRRYGDAATVAGYLPAAQRVLDFFETSLDGDGLVSLPAEWSFVDWVADWQGGSPLTSPGNGNVIYTMMFAAALRSMARLYRQNAQPEAAEQAWSRADSLCDTLRRVARGKDGLFCDELTGSCRSQHAQLWAVLSETVVGEEATRLMRLTWQNNSLASVSYCMVWLLLRAMEKAQLYHLTEPIWEKYLSLLPLNLTTWPEDDLDARSDCHAWSAVALYEFTAHGLGVRETADGKGVRIQPQMLWLGRCEGRVPTRFGIVSVSWVKKDGEFHLSVETPKKIPMQIQLPNGESYTLNSAKASYSIRL